MNYAGDYGASIELAAEEGTLLMRGVSSFGGGFPKAITPSDLQQLTNGAIDPIGDIKTGIRQAAKQQVESIKRILKGLSDIPGIHIIRDIKMAPMLKPRDLEKEYLDELNKKQLIS